MSGTSGIIENDKLDLYQYTLSRVDMYINNVDAKSANGIMIIALSFAVVIAFFSSVIINPSNGIVCIEQLLIFSDFLFGLISLYYSIITFTPRQNMQNYAKNISSETLSSNLFWGEISKKEYADFVRAIKATTVADNKDDLLRQIYICSKICAQKFKNYQIALLFLKIKMSIFTLIVFYVAYFYYSNY